MQITRLDPMQCDLDTADEMAALQVASTTADGVDLTKMSGPARLLFLQQMSDGRPVAGVFLAHERDTLVGFVEVHVPWRENTDAAMLRGHVHPHHRRRGVGSALLEAGEALARDHGRSRLISGGFTTTPGLDFLAAHGYRDRDLARYAVRRLDLDATRSSTWQRLYDEAATHAGDYELERLAGAAPDDRLEDLVAVHEAINDAPADDPDDEPDVWSTDRVREYDAAMAARRQTTYRVLARHRATGEWAGMSLLCVDEFHPTVASQEDTNVVRAHRGHRLGLLMKADMLRWVTDERPEVVATDTWNATNNHHMIAVNERLGCRVVAEHLAARKDL